MRGLWLVVVVRITCTCINTTQPGELMFFCSCPSPVVAAAGLSEWGSSGQAGYQLSVPNLLPISPHSHPIPSPGQFVVLGPAAAAAAAAAACIFRARTNATGRTDGRLFRQHRRPRSHHALSGHCCLQATKPAPAQRQQRRRRRPPIRYATRRRPPPLAVQAVVADADTTTACYAAKWSPLRSVRLSGRDATAPVAQFDRAARWQQPLHVRLVSQTERHNTACVVTTLTTQKATLSTDLCAPLSLSLSLSRSRSRSLSLFLWHLHAP